MDWTSIDRLFKALLLAAKERALIPADYSGIVAAYKQLKQEIPNGLAIRLSGCNRVLLAGSLFKWVLKDNLSYPQLAMLVASIDQAIKGTIGETRPCTKDRLATATRRFKQYMCHHLDTSTRVRHSRSMPASIDDLTTARPITLITYCSECNMPLGSIEKPFAHVDALKLLATPKTVSEFIDLLAARDILKPIWNSNARKQRSSEYMSTKPLIDAYTQLGVITYTYPDRTRNRVLSLTERGKQLIEVQP